MSFRVTALQLVNRVNRRRRKEDVGAFVETEQLATLNAINAAMEEILTEKKWEWDLRTDGEMVTRGAKTGLSMNVTSGSSSASIVDANSSLVDADAFGNYVVRIVPNGVADYASTAFRMDSANLVTSGLIFATLNVGFPATATVAESELQYGEYVLPETVAEVVRATYQEYPLTLEQVDPTVQYSEIFPRPHIEKGPPETIAVGGLDVPTYESVQDTPEPGLRMAVWPVPDDEYVIHYNYYYRHPELVEVDDVLEGVPPNIVSRIVDMATADLKTYYDLDDSGLAIRRSIMASTDEIHDSHGGSRSRRKKIGNWDSSGRRGGIRPGFPGRLIGG